VVLVETDIITSTSITASQIDQAVIMCVEIFKTDVIVYIDDVIVYIDDVITCLTSHWLIIIVSESVGWNWQYPSVESKEKCISYR
jgi:hypothetical protein